MPSVMLFAAATSTPAVALRANRKTWEMTTPYPEQTVSGRGITHFSRQVEDLTRDLQIDPRFNVAGAAPAVEYPAADALNGTLTALDEIFELPTLPLLARSAHDARALLDASGDAYRKALYAAGRHLLYSTPWPPTGLWTKEPVETVADIQKLRLRAYDETSAVVFRGLGARTVVVPMSEAIQRLGSNEVDAVLSSGDGSVGNTLARFLPCYTALNYAVPLSFATVNRNAYEGLDVELRRVVDSAAVQTEAYQWGGIVGRIQANYDRLQEIGVSVQHRVSAEIVAALDAVARPLIAAWAEKQGDRVLNALNKYGRTSAVETASGV